MTRRQVAFAAAPVSPPCFDSRLQWQEWLASAAAEQRPNHPMVLLFEAGHVRVNPNLNFCADCTQQRREAMQRAERCDPSHIQRMNDEVSA